MVAHNGSGFDSYIVLNNLPPWRYVVNLMKNGTGVVPVKRFNWYVEEKKKIPQDIYFRCGRVHFKSGLKKIGLGYILQPLVLKQEMELDDIFGDTWEARDNEWLPYVKNDVLSFAFCYARYTMGIEELTTFD